MLLHKNIYHIDSTLDMTMQSARGIQEPQLQQNEGKEGG